MKVARENEPQVTASRNVSLESQLAGSREEFVELEVEERARSCRQII